MNAARSRRLLAAASTTLAASTLAASALAGVAVAAPPTGVPANEQVALVNGTNAQHGGKSYLNSTSTVSSADGRWIAFSTDAKLVPWDRNGQTDVYLRDSVDRITILVSATGRTPGNGASFEPSVSGDGRYVSYTTEATNLVAGTEGPALDVVVRDMRSNDARTYHQLVSVDARGKARKGNSFYSNISANGRFVSIQTFARLASTDKDGTEDVYVRDLRKKVTLQASLAPRTNRDIPGYMLNGDISDSGRYVVFGQDRDLWVRDLVKGRTTRFHHEPVMPECQPFEAGSAGRPSISGDGRYVAFSSCAAKLPGDHAFGQVYRVDLHTGDVVAVTAGDNESYLPSLSRNGRYLAFGSDASDLVEGDDEGQSDAFVADLRKGTVQRASQGPDGEGGNSLSASNMITISGDGHTVIYQSYASNLVAGDSSDLPEVFAWRDGTQETPDRD